MTIRSTSVLSEVSHTGERPTKLCGLTLRTHSAIAFASDNTPVDVSTWVIVTILYLLDLRAFSMSASGTVCPKAALSVSTVAPYASRLRG